LIERIGRKAALLAATLTEEQVSIFDGCGLTIEARETTCEQTKQHPSRLQQKSLPTTLCVNKAKISIWRRF
jgi:hypothetical protein